MGSYNKFYSGADYGFEQKYDLFLGMEYKTPASDIGFAADPRSANQIKAVGDKLNTGAKAIEVQMLQPNVAEAIPNQHLDEINRLRKLTGVDLTLHGPLVEPTGVTRQGWDETHRAQAERQMWSALERSHRLDPKGNMIVTFHASHSLPEPEIRVMQEKNGKKEEVVKEMMVVNERDGQFTQIVPKKNYLLDKEAKPADELNEQNKKAWETALSQVSFHAISGKNSIEDGLRMDRRISEDETDDKFKQSMKKLWAMSKTQEGQEILQKEVYNNPIKKKIIENKIDSLNHGEIYAKEAYSNLQEHFNKAWDSTQKTIERTNDDEERKIAQKDFESLKRFQQEIIKNQDKMTKEGNAEFLAEEVQKGVNVLNSLSATPKIFRPLKEFALDKASETFSNLALRSYKAFGDSAPIISIENPPAGMGISRAEELRELVEITRKKFAKEAEKKFGLSEEQAKEQAEKLIGVTWDVGHINMIKKFGYEDKELAKQTEKIGKFVKNVHLSDNFGMEHTELPMGMGNVPTKVHMDILDKYNKKVKKMIEAGDWYQHFQTMPYAETLAAFGSPLYAMQLSPYWNKAIGAAGGYFAGYGMNPEIHHSMYGSGFANLPIELGGQMAGKSRMSGTPME